MRLYAVLIVGLTLLAADRAPAAAEPTYWGDVRPVLRKYCTVCHSTRNLAEHDVSGGLALDTYDTVLKQLKAGRSADSQLVKLVVTADTDKRMPLAAAPLPSEHVALLRRWIDTGA